MDLLKIAM